MLMQGGCFSYQSSWSQNLGGLMKPHFFRFVQVNLWNPVLQNVVEDTLLNGCKKEIGTKYIMKLYGRN